MSELPPSTAQPYRGADFYRPEDYHLFFGRKKDARNLIPLVVNGDLSLLHAPSGAGKTSLLSSAVIPLLEDRGWLAVRSLPHNDPEGQLRFSSLLRILPPLETEILALERAVRCLSVFESCTGETTLFELRAILHKAVPRESHQFIEVQRSVQAKTPWGDGTSALADDVYPFTVRFLGTATTNPNQLIRYVDALSKFSGYAPWGHASMSDLSEKLARTSIDDLSSFFSNERVRAAYVEQIDFLSAEGLSLRQFFDRICSSWGAVYEKFGLVLILDQFEEMFSRFVDQRHRGAAFDTTLPDWRKRPAYFEELGDVVTSIRRRHRNAPPIKILISMRDDHIADIDQLEVETGTIQQSSRYHLEYLDLSEAREVIEQPAKPFKFTYDASVLERILKDLPVEQGRIDPSHVQIICTRLWQVVRDKVASSDEAGSSAQVITSEDLTRTGNIDGILERYFDDFLESVEDRKDVAEILEMLEPLMTIGNKRNIVIEGEILERAFCQPKRRGKLLQRLGAARIVRIEHRLGGRFVEVTHEFLIPKIRARISREFRTNQEWRDFRSAIARLERINVAGPRAGTREVLSAREYDVLWESRRRLSYTTADLSGFWVAEVLLRNALFLGRPKREVKYWSRILNRDPPRIDLKGIMRSLQSRIMTGQLLDHIEIAEIIGHDTDDDVDEGEIRFVLDSCIVNGDAELTRETSRWIARRAHEG